MSGSSSSSSSGSWASAWASLTRWRMPFEKPPTRRSATSSRSTVAERARRAAAAGSATSRRRAHSSTSSRADRNGHSPSRSGTTPTRRCTAGSRRGSMPEHPHRAACRRREAGAQLERGRLAGAVVPSSPVTPGASANDTLGERDGVAVPLRDALEDERHGVLGPPVAPPEHQRRERHDDEAAAQQPQTGDARSASVAAEDARARPRSAMRPSEISCQWRPSVDAATSTPRRGVGDQDQAEVAADRERAGGS